jgi:hypothetical protein
MCRHDNDDARAVPGTISPKFEAEKMHPRTGGCADASCGKKPAGTRRCRRNLSFMQSLAFRTLVYRYFFFGWLFRDVTRGTRLERAAAWRHNQAQARWLPTYMRRWLWCGVTFYGLGGLVELALGAPALSAFFYVPSALSLPVNGVIAAAWLGLKALPAPF